MSWSVEFCDRHVEKEFLALPKPLLASLLKIIALIEEYGLEKTGMPYVRHLEGKLWEMRGKGKDGIARSIYVTQEGRRVVIVRSFVKKTQETPRAEIDLAHARARRLE